MFLLPHLTCIVISGALMWIKFMFCCVIFQLNVWFISYFHSQNFFCSLNTKNITVREVKVIRNDCKRPFHGSFISKEDFVLIFLNERSQLWRCVDCRKERRKTLLLETSINETAIWEQILSEKTWVTLCNMSMKSCKRWILN